MTEARATMDGNAITLIKAMWADCFTLPQNDPRLLDLTAQDALRQIFEIEVLERRRADAVARATKARRHNHDADAPESEVLRDEGAAKLADTPHLTGDAEWDAVELSETDPSKPPLTMKV